MAGRLPEAIAQAELAVERAAEGDGDGQRLALSALRQVALVTSDPAAALRTSLLGFDLAAKLGPDFRLEPPLDSTADGWREAVDQRLGIAPELEGALTDLIRLEGPEQAEAMFVLAELCAAHGDRYLAWHAYQRALDLRHPRAVDLPLLSGSARSRVVAQDTRSQFSELHHYRLRRQAVAWQRPGSAGRPNFLAAGGRRARPAGRQAFLEEHPQP